jgi:ribosomal protein S18 acetylase RimI-like enzyme
MQTAGTLKRFDPDALRDILYIRRNSFPSEWTYDDAEAYYRAMLMSEANIHIFLRDDGNRIGYLLAIPHNDAVAELKRDDPGMEEDSKRYYIETVAILPEFRGQGGFSKMLRKLTGELGPKAGKISLHARITNGFSKIMQQKGSVTKIRRIEQWKYYRYEEPADYLEVEF